MEDICVFLCICPLHSGRRRKQEMSFESSRSYVIFDSGFPLSNIYNHSETTVLNASYIKLIPKYRDKIYADATNGTDNGFVQVKEEADELTRTRKKRIFILRKTCKEWKKKGKVKPFNPANKLRNIVVDDRYRVMICLIPKVASTNLKRIFLLLTGKINTTNPIDLNDTDVHHSYDQYLHFLNQYSNVEIKEKLRTYKKIVFVREPFERLLSAYRNKFLEKNKYFPRRYGRTIITRYRPNATDEERETGKGVRFSEFIQYMVDPKTLNEDGFNEHWSHYYTLCHPCAIQYDFVGKYETIGDDVNFVLKDLAIDKFIKFPYTYKENKTVDMLEEFYKDIPPFYLTELWKQYIEDYRLFDYPYPQILKDLLPPDGEEYVEENV